MFDSETHYSDLNLFNELGFKPFKTNIEEILFLGKYKIPNYDKASIKVWVVTLPSQMWKFEITTDEYNKYIVETGSGRLTDFWNCVMQIATDMFVVTKISKT